MNELDEMQKRYRPLSQPEMSAKAKANIEQMMADANTSPEPMPEPRFARQQQWLIAHRQRLAGAVVSIAAAGVAAGIITVIYTQTGPLAGPRHASHTTVGAGQSLFPQPGPAPVSTATTAGSWPVDPSYMPIVVAIWVALGILFTAAVLTTVYAFLRRRSWALGIVAVCIGVLCALEGVDQWQGGPLGRENPHMNGQVPDEQVGGFKLGNRQLLVEGSITNHTGLPYEILSVQPSNRPSGLLLQAGVLLTQTSLGGDMLRPSATSPGTYSVGPASSEKVPSGLAHFPVSVPNSASSAKRATPLLEVTRIGRGPQVVTGVWIVYRWGPMVYRVKYNRAYGVAGYYTGAVPNTR